MTREYFDSHVLKCKRCGGVPELVAEVKSGLFTRDMKNDDDVRYRVVCYDCEWNEGADTSATRRNRSPQGALNSWNKNFGLKEEVV